MSVRSLSPTAVRPRAAELLLNVALTPAERQTVIGDINEEFCGMVRRTGLQEARAWYWRQALASLGPLARRAIFSPCIEEPAAAAGGAGGLVLHHEGPGRKGVSPMYLKRNGSGPAIPSGDDDPDPGDDGLRRRLGLAFAVSLGVNILIMQGAALMSAGSAVKAARPDDAGITVNLTHPAATATPAPPVTAPEPTPTPAVVTPPPKRHRVHYKPLSPVEPKPIPRPVPSPQPSATPPPPVAAHAEKSPGATGAAQAIAPSLSRSEPSAATPLTPQSGAPRSPSALKSRPTHSLLAPTSFAPSTYHSAAPVATAVSVVPDRAPMSATLSIRPGAVTAAETSSFSVQMITHSASGPQSVSPTRMPGGPISHNRSLVPTDAGRNRILTDTRSHADEARSTGFVVAPGGGLRPGETTARQGGLRSHTAATVSGDYGGFVGSPALTVSGGPGGGGLRSASGPMAGQGGHHRRLSPIGSDSIGSGVRPGRDGGPAGTGLTIGGDGGNGAAGSHHAVGVGNGGTAAVDGGGSTGFKDGGNGPDIAGRNGGGERTVASPGLNSGPVSAVGATLAATRSAEVTRRVSPETPDSLRGTAYDVRVTVSIRVLGSGGHRATITRGSGYPELDAAVLAAIRAYRFTTALQEGKPTDSTIVETIHLINK